MNENKYSGLLSHLVKQEDKTQWLWRYMDLAKFVSLLSKKALFFPRAEQFDDKREGLLLHPEDERIEKTLKRYKALKNGQKDAVITTLNDDQYFLRKFYLISCWNKSEHESVALWNLYTKDQSGISIRTDIPSLSEELKKHKHTIHENAVDYEPIMGTRDRLKAFFRKSPEYKFESEYRFIVDLGDDPFWAIKDEDKFSDAPEHIRESILYKGLYLPIDLTKVIKEIRMHYRAPAWHIEDTRKLVEAFDIDPSIVKKSDLQDN